MAARGVLAHKLQFQGSSMVSRSDVSSIRTRSCSSCYLCGSRGEVRYQRVRDFAFGVPGEWNFLHCSDCGLLWLDPQPVPENVALIYEGYQTHKIKTERKFASTRDVLRRAVLSRFYGYDLDCTWSSGKSILGTILSRIPFARELMGMEIMHISAREGGRLLDVGCGSGKFLATMRDLNWQVQGTEIDVAAADIAKQVHDLPVFVGELRDASFENESFDVITLNHVIEHVYDPIELLKECSRLLRPDGKLILATPNTQSLGHAIFRRWWRGLEPPRHLILFSTQALKICLEKAGLHVVAMQSSSRMALPLYVSSELIKRAETESPWYCSKAAGFLKLQGCLFQFIEAIAGTFSKGIGEEIYFVGTRVRGATEDATCICRNC